MNDGYSGKNVYANGDTVWYSNGHLHKEDGPAVDHASGYKAWMINGKRHRLDGPARIYPGGGTEWYLNGNYINVKSQKEFEQFLKFIAFI
jgi:hypothetical protein